MAPPRADPVQRILLGAKRSRGCLLYERGLDTKGYGHVFVGKAGRPGSRRYAAHRLIYEATYGNMPRHLEVDHTCSNPACVNIGHLEAVTHAENIRRMLERGHGVNQRKTHCKNGHEFTPENTYVTTRGTRECVTCRKEWRTNPHRGGYRGGTQTHFACGHSRADARIVNGKAHGCAVCQREGKRRFYRAEERRKRANGDQ